jgi:hypothetical protein
MKVTKYCQFRFLSTVIARRSFLASQMATEVEREPRQGEIYEKIMETATID